MKRDFVPVSISGIGTVTCVGTSSKALFEAAVKGSTGIVEGVGRISESTYATFKKNLNLSETSSKSLALALTSINEAFTQAGWAKLNSDDGLIIATTTGQIDLWEENLMNFTRNKSTDRELSRVLKNQPLGSTLEVLCQNLNFDGQKMLLSTACSAATQGIGLANLWIQSGRVKRCLVGGVEILSRLTLEGFRSLQLLNPNPATPFDAQRKGINLSEGAAFLCLEKNPKKSLAIISGFGTSTDAYHMTSPHPEGRGSYEAMSLALQNAGLEPGDIDWVHAHGTGSRANDDAEGTAIRELFQLKPWVSSTKNIHGHMLGASGAVEAALCVMALQTQMILKTAGLHQPDVELRHPEKNLNTPIKHILKNTLGFGGNNGALILSQS